MQSTTGTLRAALDARVRRLRGRLAVDWDKNGYGTTIDDLSGAFDSIVVERALTGAPDDLKLVAGHVAGQLVATLATPGKSATGTWVDPRVTRDGYYSPYRTDSPLFGKTRTTRPVDHDVIVTTTAGQESLPQFTGKTTEIDADDGTLTALDGWADAAAYMQLPLVVADDLTYTAAAIKPGLFADWIVDYIFRRLGYYASPPKRANCLVSATMHGSTYPEVGTLTVCYGENYSDFTGFSPDADPLSGFNQTMKFHRGVYRNGQPQEQEYGYPLLTGSGNGQAVAWEGWVRWNTTAADLPFFQVYTFGHAQYVSAFWQVSTGRIVLTMKRNDGSGNVALNGPVVSPGTSAPHYIYVHVAYDSAGADVTFRYDSTTTSASVAATGAGGNYDRIRIGRGAVTGFVGAYADAIFEAVQLTSEPSPGPYNDAFVPTALLDSSDNMLAATPASSSVEAASILAQIADAEAGQIGFSETGIAYFTNRYRWERPPATVSQKTISTRREITRLPIREAVELVRNKITARVQTPTILANQDVWRQPKPWSIGSSSTKTFLVHTENPVTNVDTSVAASSVTGGTSRYYANRQRDGAGALVTNLSFVITQIDVDTIRVAVTNPNAFFVWLVNTSGTTYFLLGGDIVKFGDDNEAASSGYKAESADTAATIASAATHGERLLELNEGGDNPFFQDLDSAQRLVDALALVTATPKPVIEEFEIRGDPSLQLGDRFTAVDPETGVNADFFLTKCRSTLDRDGGFKQVIDGRGA